MYAVIGLVILMGLQPFAEIRCHWDTRVMYDFPHVRECMTRFFLLLIYCRYIHMASKQDRTPGDDGYDILHHIRYGVLICGGRKFLGERYVQYYITTVLRVRILILHHAFSTAAVYIAVSCQGIRRNSKHGVEHVLSPWEVDFVRRTNGCEQGAIQQGCAAVHAKQTHQMW